MKIGYRKNMTIPKKLGGGGGGGMCVEKYESEKSRK